jgi:ligand-binding sensor domain-containing protein/signal transduction histidine kinase
VQALAETPDGVLWIGTTGGLASFGGAHIRVFSEAQVQALETHSIFCLEIDRDGSLWAGTEGGGLLHLRGESVEVFSNADGLTDGFVRSVLEDSRGVLWVGTDDGLFRMKGRRLERVDGRNGMPAMAVHHITEDRDGDVWAGGSQLVEIDRSGAGRVYSLPGAYSKNRVKRILQTADGTIWVGTVGGLQRMGPIDRVKGRFEPLPQIHATVRSLLQTSDGTLWIGTIGGGLWKLRGDEAPQRVSPSPLPSDTVLSMLQDHDGQIWIGTQAGLVRLSRTPVNVVPLPQGGDPDFETISGDARGNVWVAAQGLYVIHEGKARRLTFPRLGSVSVRNVFRARDGALWVGTDGSGAYQLDGDSVEHLSAPGELTNNFVRGFLQSRDGAIWIATDEGVSRVKGGDVRKFTEASGLAFFSTRCLLEDRTGGIWIGTDRGISLWKDGSFQHNAATKALEREQVWTILEDRQGVLWFGTRDHGLFRDRDGHMEHYTVAQGLPSNSFYQLLQDHRGVFWFTGPDMIASISEAEMDGGSPSVDRPLSVTVYTMPFGADDAQMYGGRQPAGFLAPDDSLWFPTSRGAAFLRPERTMAEGAGPRAAIDELTEDGRRIPLREDSRISASVTRMTLGFGAIFLRPQTGLHFRYRLEPLEHTWTMTSTDDAATYTNLAAGSYRFRVQAFDAAHPEKVSEAEFDFSKAPLFYQTWWFGTLALLVVAVVIWGVYRLRVGQMHTRFQAVLAERSRLAREMHDTVIQGCTGVSALLEAMASHGEDKKDSSLLDFARQQVRATIDEARRAVWDMRHEEKQVDVLEAIRGLAEQTKREHGSEVTLKVAAEPLRMGTSAAHEILMTVREAVYNAVQHSGSHRIEMTAQTQQDELTVRIADNGRGFDSTHTAEQNGHFGLVGMRERMKRLGGKLELTTAPGKGTVVTLRVGRMQRRRFGAPASAAGEVNGKLL